MKKILSVVMAIGMTVASQAIDTIYQGSKKEAKNILCYYQSGRFYADSNRKNCIYHHPGNMAAKGSLAKPDSSIYRFMGDKAYKGYSIKKEDCLASIVATKTVKGNTVNAKIYEGFAIARDKVEKGIKGGTELTGWKVSRDGVNAENIPVLFTVADNMIFKGDSTKPEDCLLTYTGSFNNSRLLFMALELSSLKK